MKKINYWISGASGSWGNELIKQLLSKKDTGKIIGFSRSEFAQVETTRRFNDCRLQMMIGDVRDYERITETMKNIDIVFHLAALKHLNLCQETPNECIKTNVYGSQNVIKSSIKNNVNKCILVSTDKASGPVNIYGTSKYLAEQLFLHANTISKTKFSVIRAGNVLASRGSIIPVFIKKAKNKEPLTITDYRMTRYFFTLPNAINLVLRASTNIQGGETFITIMPSAKIIDIAKTIWNFYNNKSIDNKHFPEIGIISGEKIDETLVTKYEAVRTVVDETFRIILPMDGSLDDYYKDYSVMKETEYNSSQSLMGEKQIKELLQEAGYLK